MMFSKFKNFVRVMMAVGQWDHRYPRITIDTEIRRSGRDASKEGTFNNTEGERIDETMSQRNESIGSQLHTEEDEEDISSEADSHNVSDRGGNSINGAASDSSDEESEHDVDGDGGDEMILHPGFLEFLSRRRNNSIQRLNSIVQQLRGSQVHCRKRCYFDDENHNRACCHCDNEIDDTATPSMPLCQIRLIRDQIRDEGIIRIADAMEEGCSCCPYNNQNNYNDDKKMKASSCNSRGLIQMPCSCPTRYLSEINLSMSHIGDLGVCSLAHAISKACLPSLHSVDVSSNNITGIGVICLANCSLSFGGVYDNETGSNQPRIEKLCLSSNEIGSLGASALANALCGYRSKCGFSSEDGEKNVTTHVEFDGSPASIAVPGPRGICSLKTLSLSQCKLNDCDATVFGEALLPHRDAAPIHFGVKRQESPRGSACKQEMHEVKIGTKKFRNDYSLPSQPESHSLKKLHLYGNLITLAGMEFLHSVIHSCGQASALEDLQSLYSQSNHMIDIGVIIDHGTQDDHIGPFFNQEEDNKLISSIRDMKSIERLRKNATTITPAGHQIASVADKDGDNPKELQELLIKKMILKDSIARDLAINIQCAQHISLSRMSPFLNRPLHFDDARRITRRILGVAAREKIVHVLKDALCHPRIGGLLPTHYISSNCNNHCEGFKMPFSSERASSSSIAQIFSDIDDTLFPHAISWALRYCTSFSLALTFEVLSTNPDVCSCTNNSNAT